MSKKNELSPEQLIELEDKYFAQMIRFCAAQYEGDEEAMEKAGDILDNIWKQVGNRFEPQWKNACRHIADSVAGWPKDTP